MAKKYKASLRHKTQKKVTEANSEKEPALIGRGKILAILILGTLVAAGIYIAAMKMRIAVVFHLYWAVTAVLLCAFIFLKQRRDYLYEKSVQCGSISEEDKACDRSRRKKIKYLLLVLLPFLFTVIGDAVYLMFLQDLKLAESISMLIG